MLQKRQPIIYGDGRQERSFSYVSDDVEPLVKMGTLDVARSEVINIGPDKEVVTVLEVAKIVADVIGFPLDPIFKPARPREVKIAHCSADKARALLGYEPKVSLREAIEKTVDWIARRGTKPFSYNKLSIEIESDKLPETWAKRLF
jgi:UDP-glucose 4-epimerase